MKKPIFAVMATASAVLMTASAALAEVECTIGNWSSTVGMTANTFSVGKPGNSNRRFAGPCGLRVNVDGTARYLVDNSPSAETSYNARFYFFVNGTLPNDAVIFSARTAADDADVLRLRNTSSGMVLDGAGSSAFVSTSAIALSNGWNVVEISWNQSSASMLLNGAEAQPVDSGLDQSLTIGAVRLGNVSGATGSSVSIDFDDFDSRRTGAPEGLCLGLTRAGASALAFEDIENIFREIATAGNVLAGGQPDFDRDGEVSFGDIEGVFQRIASANESCSNNSF